MMMRLTAEDKLIHSVSLREKNFQTESQFFRNFEMFSESESPSVGFPIWKWPSRVPLPI